MAQIDRRDILFILIIIILALFFRAMYFKDYAHTDIYPLLPYSDGDSYYIWARDISGGDLWGSKAFMKWPLYAYLLAFLFKLSANSISFVYGLQFVVGAINCVLIYFIAKKIFNQAVAFIAALLCVWYGLFIFYEGLLIYTSFSLFLNSLLFLSILHIQNHPNKKNLFWTGILLGICTITQANIIIFGISAIIWILRKNRLSFSKLIYNFSCFLFGLSIVIGAVTLRNYLVEKDFVLIAGHTGVNFYCGNNPLADGKASYPIYFTATQDGMFRDAKIIAKNSLGRVLKTSEVSNFWFNQALDFIKYNPGAFLKLLFKKTAYLFSPREFIHDPEYDYIMDKIKIFKIMFLDLRFILPFGFLGMFLNLKRLKETPFALLYMIIIAISFSIILFFVATRYRIAMLPFLMVFISSGLFSIWDTLKKKNYLKFGLICIAILIIFTLFYYNIFNKNRGVYWQERYSHLRKAMVFLDHSDYQNAVKEARVAYQMQPDSPHVIFSLGAVYYRMNDFKMAEEKFKEAIRIFPLSVDSYYNLGLLYNKQRRFAEGKNVLEKAISLDPDDAGAHFELGKTYKAAGNLKRAREEFSLALQKINKWRTQERAMIRKELAEAGK